MTSYAFVRSKNIPIWRHPTKQSKRSVLTEEKVQDIEARLEISPRKSLRRLAQEIGVSLGSAFTATKSLVFITPVAVVERFKACNVFARSVAGIVCLNPTQGMDVWCVCVCLCCPVFR
jgi:hypothetical protein